MPVSELKRRRTFAIISHPDAGKTTLTEKLLLFSGAIQIAGTVKARKSAAPRDVRLDGNRKAARHFGREFGDAVRVPRPRDQPARYAGPPGLLGRHLPRADRGRCRRDGDRRAPKAWKRRRSSCSKFAAARNTPILTFINKLDREVREPLELLDEIEQRARHPVRAVHLADRHGQGLPRRLRHPARPGCACSEPAQDKAGGEVEIVQALATMQRERTLRPAETQQPRKRSSWCTAPRHAFDREAFLAGKQTPVFFGSAINNFGVKEILDALVDLGAAAAPRDATVQRPVDARRAEVHRRRLQGAGQHGPGAPRPRRLHARVLGPFRARHGAQGHAHRQGISRRTTW